MTNSLASHVALAFLLAAAVGSAHAQSPARHIRITLKPAGAAQDADRIAVMVRVTGITAAAGRALFDTPLITAGEPGPSFTDAGVVASDASGPLPLLVTDDTSDAGGFVRLRHFLATRATSGTITLTYVASFIAFATRIPASALNLSG